MAMMIEAQCERCSDTIVETAEQRTDGTIDVEELGDRVDVMVMAGTPMEGGEKVLRADGEPEVVERLMIRHAFGVDGKRCNGWGWVTRSWE